MPQPNPRLYLNVPYGEKDAAKQLGARWDAEQKKWFVPSGIEPAAFERWFIIERQAPQASTQNLPSTGSKLTIELVPKTCWYSNVRSEVSAQTWDLLKKRVYQQANYRCEICGGKGDKHPVECHEIWDYDDEQRVQTLKGLTALCPACHECKHIGYATVQGRGEIATAHITKVNDWSPAQAEIYIKKCFEIWQARSLIEWTLDISYLDSILTRPQ
jgi:5-methylcytosine-specific restriction endonuclease McrA